MIPELKAFIEKRYEKSEYPSLEFQSREWAITNPLQGLQLLDATPVFENTIAKYIPLLEAGADLTVGISNVMPRDEEIVTFLRETGIKIITPNDNSEFDIILDCAAAFSNMPVRAGYVELTRSGIAKYTNFPKPVYAADSSLIKHIETSLGTGESYFRAMAQLGYKEWAGKKLIIFGNGKVGKGIAAYGYRNKANVVVFNENSPGKEIISEISKAYAIVTATGIKGAVSKYAKQLENSTALLANMGVEDEFGERIPSGRVLENKRPLNFILREPTHMKYIETTMALHNLCAVEILKNKDKKGLIQPDTSIEQKLMDIVRQHGKIADELRLLTSGTVNLI